MVSRNLHIPSCQHRQATEAKNRRYRSLLERPQSYAQVRIRCCYHYECHERVVQTWERQLIVRTSVSRAERERGATMQITTRSVLGSRISSSHPPQTSSGLRQTSTNLDAIWAKDGTRIIQFRPSQDGSQTAVDIQAHVYPVFLR